MTQLLMAAAVAAFMAGMGVWLWECFLWMKYGSWPALSVLWLLQRLDRDAMSWVYTPSDWIGLHRLLDWLPLPSGCVILCVLLVWAAIAFDQPGRKP